MRLQRKMWLNRQGLQDPGEIYWLGKKEEKRAVKSLRILGDMLGRETGKNKTKILKNPSEPRTHIWAE